MANSDQEREQELAELLKEVRALRKTIDELKAGPALQPKLSPDYEVVVRSQPELQPDYEVVVRTVPAFQPPSYDVLARPAVEKSGEPPGDGQ